MQPEILKVSIPSPFARFELMQEAFKNVSANQENAYTRDKRLVSFMLDVAQLYYESGYDSIEDWQQGTSLDELKTGLSLMRYWEIHLKCIVQKKHLVLTMDSLFILLFVKVRLWCNFSHIFIYTDSLTQIR